jgi:von Willebrand factor A domain-containing protein 7
MNLLYELLIVRISAFILFSNISLDVECFIATRTFNHALDRIHEILKLGVSQVSKTVTHEEIIRRGLVRSVVKYFYDQPNGAKRINLSKIDNYYYNLSKLYYDYYDKWYCWLELDYLITNKFEPNVALVDFDSRTKDLPYAHFDAETFKESNERVREYLSKIYYYLGKKDYDAARVLSAQIAHSIQDFYSHSNWIEMGNTKINDLIGRAAFYNQQFANLSDNITCANNCTIIQVNCTSDLSSFNSLLEAIGVNLSIDCPLKFYNCSNNILVLNKLVSGFYSNQRLSDGTPVQKPSKSFKCSHGGFLDSTSKNPAIGGINKDSGYFIMSPHADLHLVAANLASDHTEYLFNQIRDRIGDEEFSQFLMLAPNNDLCNIANGSLQTCKGFHFKPDKFWIYFIFHFLLLLYY